MGGWVRMKPEYVNGCAHCYNGRGRFKCGKCTTKYCSKDCQTRNWVFHKISCDQSKKKTRTTKPKPEMVMIKLLDGRYGYVQKGMEHTFKDPLKLDVEAITKNNDPLLVSELKNE